MKAKEMFEELGYRLIPNINIKSIISDKDLRFNQNIIKAYEYYDERFFSYTYILFLENNKILKWNYSHQRIMFITFEEIKAINKQVSELGGEK